MSPLTRTKSQLINIFDSNDHCRYIQIPLEFSESADRSGEVPCEKSEKERKKVNTLSSFPEIFFPLGPDQPAVTIECLPISTVSDGLQVKGVEDENLQK